jgi:uncharacterized delta-60 repeat protein
MGPSMRRVGGILGVLMIWACLAAGSASAAGLDPSFGEAGIATTPLETAAREGVDLGIGPDGAAVVGNAYGYLVRFGPEGARDLGFGAGGKLSLTPDPIAEGVAERSLLPSDFVVDGKGRLLVFGEQIDGRRVRPIPRTSENQTATESEALVLRFDPEGKLDPTFGAGGGFLRSTFGLQSKFFAKMPQTDAVAGTVDSQDRPVFLVGAAAIELGCHAGAVTHSPEALVRLTEAGSVDTSFGREGLVPITGSTGSPTLTLDAHDRAAIRLGQYVEPELNCRAGTALARLDASGRGVASFGSHGVEALGRNLDLDFVTPAGAMILDHTKGRTLEVVRIGLSGRPDKGFGEGGTAKLPLAVGAHVHPVGVDAQGRVLLAGFIGRGPYPSLGPKGLKPTLLVGRLLRDGRPDKSFGRGGWIRDPVPGSLEVGAATAAIDPQGRLLLAATVTARGQSSGGYLLARFLLGAT